MPVQAAQVPIQIPQVPLADAANFAKVWTYGGLVVPLQDVHVRFASDYANIVLRNFVMQAAMARLMQAQKESMPQPKLVVED